MLALKLTGRCKIVVDKWVYLGYDTPTLTEQGNKMKLTPAQQDMLFTILSYIQDCEGESYEEYIEDGGLADDHVFSIALRLSRELAESSAK